MLSWLQSFPGAKVADYFGYIFVLAVDGVIHCLDFFGGYLAG
jgi:hypothetical protein